MTAGHLNLIVKLKKIPQAVNIITSFIVVGVSGRGLDIHTTCVPNGGVVSECGGETLQRSYAHQ